MKQLFHRDQRLGLQTKGSQWVWLFFVRCDNSRLFCMPKTRKHCVNKACVKARLGSVYVAYSGCSTM